MTRSVVLLALLTISLLSRSAWGTPGPSSAPAVMPWVVEVYRAHCPGLTGEAHIDDCWTGYVGEELHLVVMTEQPAPLSTEIDTISVLPEAPPPTPPVTVAGRGGTSAEEPDCGSLPWDAAVGRCRFPAVRPTSDVCLGDLQWGWGSRCEGDVLSSASSQAAVLAEAAPPVPPPPGVVVLYPGGEREEREDCPEGFRETSGAYGWRFCVDKVRPEAIPPLWAPPIAGIPYEEGLEILKRYKATLMQLPGVTSVGFGHGGIRVHTDQPALAPSEVEGLPVIAGPPLIGRSLPLVE